MPKRSIVTFEQQLRAQVKEAEEVLVTMQVAEEQRIAEGRAHLKAQEVKLDTLRGVLKDASGGDEAGEEQT